MKNAGDIKVSVAVLTYKRQDELLRTLESIACQDRAGVEVIVVNNHPDDTGEVLSRRYPEVKYIEMRENAGCGARNEAIKAAAGDVVVMLDNDVCLGDRGALDRIVRFFETHPGAACVSFRVLMPEGRLSLRDWCHPREHVSWSMKEFRTNHISEGASAFRREAFLSVGGYFAPFFIGHEGPDLSVRLIKAGHEIWYSPAIETTHYASRSARPDWRAYYFNTRNNVWLAYRHYPAMHALRHIVLYTAMTFVYALGAGHLTAFFRGLFHAAGGIGSMERRPMDRDSYGRLKAVLSEKPSTLGRIRKHISSGQSYR